MNEPSVTIRRLLCSLRVIVGSSPTIFVVMRMLAVLARLYKLSSAASPVPRLVQQHCQFYVARHFPAFVATGLGCSNQFLLSPSLSTFLFLLRNILILFSNIPLQTAFRRVYDTLRVRSWEKGRKSWMPFVMFVRACERVRVSYCVALRLAWLMDYPPCLSGV